MSIFNLLYFTEKEVTTPMMPPVGLKTFVLSSSTVLLTWTDTSLGSSQRTTDNRFYTVRYAPVQGSNRRFKYLNSTGLNCHIDNLKPYTNYEFSVKVVKGRRQSTWSMSVLNRTEEAGKEWKVHNLISKISVKIRFLKIFPNLGWWHSKPIHPNQNLFAQIFSKNFFFFFFFWCSVSLH